MPTTPQLNSGRTNSFTTVVAPMRVQHTHTRAHQAMAHYLRYYVIDNLHYKVSSFTMGPTFLSSLR